MDLYFPKTRRPPPIKRAPKSAVKKLFPPESSPSNQSETKPNNHTDNGPSTIGPSSSKQSEPQATIEEISTPTTPKNARIPRPLQPPPVKRKALSDDTRSCPDRPRPISLKELFKSAHPLDIDNNNQVEETHASCKGPAATAKSSYLSKKLYDARHNGEQIERRQEPLASPLITARPTAIRITDQKSRSKSPIKSSTPSPNKISSGPLKGLSTSLIDIIKAKELARNKRDPELDRKRELLGIAPEIVRIIPTVFTANKRNVLPYDKIVEKCFKGLRSNYTSSTIIECLNLLDRVAPDWVSTVEISRGKFMKFNKDKYTIPQLMTAIDTYKAEKLTVNKK